MSAAADFIDFRAQFFALLARKTFGRQRVDYLTYLNQPNRHGDEAWVVDTAISGQLLELLGFGPAERNYNQQRHDERPDFAPTSPVYGTCFVIEDKSTATILNFDLANPDSHLSQLARYVRSTATSLGWLTNGRQLTVWDFKNRQAPRRILDIDIPQAICEWQGQNPPVLSSTTERALHDLFDLFRKDAFTDMGILEQQLGISLEEWQQQALPLGAGSNNEPALVETLQSLVLELQRDARRILDYHLERAAEYFQRSARLTDGEPELAVQKLRAMRERIMSVLITQCKVIWGLEDGDIAAIEAKLLRLEQDIEAYFSPKEVQDDILLVINAARKRKYAGKPRAAQPMSNFDDVAALREAMQACLESAFDWHKRQATLRHDYQRDRQIYDDYTVWESLVQETMLGNLSEEQRRAEFALQAAYVVFIRLLLIRVCEDKGVFPGRFISDGELKHWQEDIKRYFVFAQGNPYDPLLDMAYANAQNIYAHFFTGRELFNWYRLDREHFVMALHRLSRFNFAGVDSDIIGTIYNTYVNRKEKREKGQYYTPPQIVDYILDHVGYREKAMIGSQKRLIDPACGSGSFLVAAAKRLVAAHRASNGQVDDPEAVLQRLQQTLFGFDLNPFACYLAEVNLLIQVLDLVKQAHDRGKRPRLERFHIYNVDALARPTGRYYYTHFHTLLAEENDQVEQIKSRGPHTPYAGGFTYVVANPPYGASLSDGYKETLRSEWGEVFYGQPDTYTFFLALGLELLASNGKLGFITPNTYLMGTHTARLRGKLLGQGRIEQIVDLPQSIWSDANVDCALLFLAAESDEGKRRTQQVAINMLGLRDTLDKLEQRVWTETMRQPQSTWLDDPEHKIRIRHDTLLQQIEDACRVPVNGNGKTKVLRLQDVTESTQGIIPYHTKAEGDANPYIKFRRNVPTDEPEWKPLLDGRSFIGRYELRWSNDQPYLKYGNWLYSVPRAKFFDSPKLLVQDMRNRALKRRLVATYDDRQFYNRHNFDNIIAKDSQYDLKYVLALFNSLLLNYWFARQFDNLHINPSYFRQLPIYPADAETQAVFAALVDQLLAKQATLNAYRAQGYTIDRRRDGSRLITVPYDRLMDELQQADRTYPTLTLYDARIVGMISIPDRCDLQTTISSNVFIPEQYPTTLVLRHNKLWLESLDESVRRYLPGILKQPQWQGKTWDEIKDRVFIPGDTAALTALFALEERKRLEIAALLDESARIDREIDERVLDLYQISDSGDRERVLSSVGGEAEDML
jgi:type I restriction enzyme M protein